MKSNDAKKLIHSKLTELGLSELKLTSKTVSFEDLARGSCLFVYVHGWTPDPRWDELENLAKANGFRVMAKNHQQRW